MISDDGFGIGKNGDGDTNPATHFWLLLYKLSIGGFKFRDFFFFSEFSD